MTVANSTPGSFRTFSQEAFGPAMGFIVGWIYWTGLVLAMSSEAAAVSVFLNAWFPKLPLPVLGSIIITAVTLSNLLGARRLSKLESVLALVKLLAVIGFIIIAAALVTGLFPDKPAAGIGLLQVQAAFPSGIAGIAGSMLIVMFTYAGFEIIGLAASEAHDPHRTVPRAISYTITALVGLYILSLLFLLLLIPTDRITGEISPFVEALSAQGISWAADIMNIVLITAILSTMLAATFGLARMLRSLAVEGYAPVWIKDRGEIPYKGILFSGAAMIAGLGLGFLLPKNVYVFLVSSGGFSLLLTYLVIMATHYKFRKHNGCPPKGNCQLPGYPYTSWLGIAVLAVIIGSMPLIPGQGSGLLAGLLMVAFFLACYAILGLRKKIGRKNMNQ
jgi:AAT family amino acid transporter